MLSRSQPMMLAPPLRRPSTEIVALEAFTPRVRSSQWISSRSLQLSRQSSIHSASERGSRSLCA
jgi:hypothetical protein